jgi:hypothetical protein
MLASCQHQRPLDKLEGRNAGSQFDRAYNLDNLNDQPFDGKAPVLETSFDEEDWVLTGWAIDAAAKHPAGGVVLLIDRKRELLTNYGVLRADVAAALGEPKYRRTGFELHLKPDQLAKGKHTISMLIISADGRAFYRTKAEWSLEVR